MKSNLISKSETAAVIARVSEEWGIDVPGVRNLMVYQAGGAQIMAGGGLRILAVGGRHVPFLSATELLGRFPSVTVDMGAVRFMCKGANVMRPGIVAHTEFGEGDTVCVADESQHKFLAVGRALVPSSAVGGMERGEVLENVHYISDRYWEAGKGIPG